jgi:hypothetical protein
MANWWDDSPIVSEPQTTPAAQPQTGNWWESSPQVPQQPGTSWGDIARMGMTAGVRGLGLLADAAPDPLAILRKLVSPDMERIEKSGNVFPGQMAGDAVFGATGIPEYQPTTPAGRTAMSMAQGGVAGAPFGLIGAGIGALTGGMGQGTQELTGPEGLDLLSPQNSERAGAVAGLVPGGTLALSRMRPQRAEVPMAPELANEGGAGYDRTRAFGVEVAPDAMADMARRVQRDLRNQGTRRSFAPDTLEILDEVASPPNTPGARALYEFADIHALRRSLNEVIKNNLSGPNAKRSDARAASRTIRELDNFINDLGKNPQNLVAGTPQAATELADVFRTANRNYAQSQKLNALTGDLDRAVTGIGERAEGRARATNSGRNFDNNLRGRVETYLENPRDVLGLTDAEMASMEAVRDGGFVRNRARDVSNILGGGGGLQQFISGLSGLAGGFAQGGLKGAAIGGVALPVTGLLARVLQNALGRRSLRQAGNTIGMNSPLYQDRLAQLPPRDLAVLHAILPGLLAQPQQQMPPIPGLLAPQ